MKKALIIGGIVLGALLVFYVLFKAVSTKASVAYNNMVPLKASGVSSQTPNSPLSAAAGAFTGVVTGFALKKLTSWLSDGGGSSDSIPSDDSLMEPGFSFST